MNVAKNAQTAAAKWARNLSSAGQTIQDGVMAMTVNPAQLAAAQADVAVANYTAAKSKMVAGLNRVQLSDIQQAMIKKGIPRISEGATAAQGKMATFLGQLIPAVQTAVASLPPRGNASANEQRMLQFSRAMKQFKRS